MNTTQRAALQSKADQLSFGIVVLSESIRRERDAVRRAALMAAKKAALKEWGRMDSQLLEG